MIWKVYSFRRFINIQIVILKTLKLLHSILKLLKIIKLSVRREKCGNFSVCILLGYLQITGKVRFRPKKQHPSVSHGKADAMPFRGSDQPGAHRNNACEELLSLIRAGEKYHIQAHAVY